MRDLLRWRRKSYSISFKWYYLVAIGLGLAAIVLLVWLATRNSWIMERLGRSNNDDPEAIDYSI
jgi:hypothetical protein